MIRGGLRANLLFAGCVVLTACGGSKISQNPPPPASVTIKQVGPYYANSPALNVGYAIAGQGTFQLLVNGAGFTSSSVVKWNGNPLPTQFGDSTDLAAIVDKSLIATPGSVTIQVSDSGAVSNSVVLPIASPAAATAGVVALISAAPDGSPANGDSLVSPSISATGRFVAFQSNATNLAPGPASGYQEIYERDTCIGAPTGCTPSTIRITVTYDGTPVNAHSRSSAISADGRYVAFDTSATNILPNSDICNQEAGYSCVFLRDTCIGAPTGCMPKTIPLSLDSTGAVAVGSGPIMTPNARFISFVSTSSWLGSGSDTTPNLFIHDTCLGVVSGCTPKTILASVPSDGTQGNSNSLLQGISSTGRYVEYLSWATNMVPNETTTPGIFWRDTCIGVVQPCSTTTIRADVSTNGAQANQQATYGQWNAISADGRMVAFGSYATNLISNFQCTDVYGCSNVFVHDTCAGATASCAPGTSMVSVANDGSIGNCTGGGSPGNQSNVSMSADGRFISFGSISTNLSPDDTWPACGWEDIFVRDTCFGAAPGCTPSTVRVSVANTTNPGTSGNNSSSSNVISADGHYVAFISPATNFLPGGSNGHAMVYLAKTGFF